MIKIVSGAVLIVAAFANSAILNVTDEQFRQNYLGAGTPEEEIAMAR
jgi:preprotein translocase subunit Sec63